MNRDLKAGKGLQLHLTEDMIEWLTATMDEVRTAFGSEATYIQLDEGEMALRARLGHVEGWFFESDKFGKRMVASYSEDGEDSSDELRVAVIVTARGDLKLDVRTWYSPF